MNFQMESVDGHCSMLYLPCYFVFPVLKWCAKMTQNVKTWQIYPWTTCKSFKSLLLHCFPVLVKDEPIWNQTSQSKLFSIAEKSQVIWIWFGFFFTDANIVVLSVDFFSVKFQYILRNYWNLNSDFNSLLGKNFQ